MRAFAHLPGFLVSWRLSDLPEMPYKTALFFNRFDIGDGRVRLIGGLWLMAMLIFAAGETGLLSHAMWWKGLVIAGALLSPLLSVSGLPEARIGVVANLVILVYLGLVEKAAWLPLPT